MKKRLTLLMACVLLVALVLTSCGTGTKSEGTASTTTTAAASASTVAATPTPEPPAEITMYFPPNGTVWQEFDFSNCWFTDYIEEKANVKFTNILVPPHADYWTKFEMLVASGELPDLSMVCTTEANVKKWGMEGAFLPVDKYIDNSPTLSKILDASQREFVRAEDGKTYAIYARTVNSDFGTGEGFAYRADILKRLGLEKPTTLEGWLDALRKYKKESPDKIPYSTFALRQYYEFMFSPFNVSIYNSYTFDDATSKFTHLFENENFYKAVEFGRLLYSEGLLDKEFMTHTKADYTNKIYSKDLMIIVKNRGGINEFIKNYSTKGDANAQLLPSYYPAASGVQMEGGAYKHWAPLTGMDYVINAKCKNPDACVRVLEVLATDEVNQMVAYGREGKEFNVVNGEKVPIEPANTDNGWRLCFGGMFGINTVERMNYGALSAIDTIPNFSADQKAAYKKAWTSSMTDIETKIMTNKPRNSDYMKPLDDALNNKNSTSITLQRSLIAQAIMGEITMDDLRAQGKKIIADDTDIIAAFNKNMAEAVTKYNLK